MTKPAFPNSLKSIPIFSDTLNALEGKTEVSPQFACGAILVGASAVLGRRAGLNCFPKPMYPTMYLVLCGESGGSLKSSTMNFVKGVIKKADEQTRITTGLATPEGLVRMLSIPEGHEHGDQRYTPPKQKEAVDRYVRNEDLVERMLQESSEYEGFRSLIILDELASLLKKARGSGDGIIERLSELYGSPDKVENPSSGDPIEAINPHISILSAIPQSWLNKNLRAEDMEGALGRRLMFLCDSETEPIANPGPPDSTYVNKLVLKIGEMRSRHRDQRIYEYSTEAEKQLEKWYTQEFHPQLKTGDSELNKVLLRGKDTNIRKIALMFAALDDESEFGVINIEHLKHAGELADYIYECQTSIFDRYSTSETHEMDNKIIALMEKKPGPLTTRQIYRSLKCGAKDVKASLESLQAMGEVTRTEEKEMSGGKEIIVIKFQRTK